MIRKIEFNNKFGCFNKISKFDTLFKRYNLIYGGNGSGKSTLSKLFSLHSSIEKDEYKKELLEAYGIDKKDFKFIIENDTVLTRDIPIYVYNDAFVSNYVFSGYTANVESFTSVNSNVEMQSAELKRLKKEELELSNQEKKLNGENEKLEQSFNNVKATISGEFNSKIKGSKMFSCFLESTNYDTSITLDEVNTTINNLVASYNELEKTDTNKDTSSIQSLTLNKLDIPTISEIEEIFTSSIQDNASNRFFDLLTITKKNKIMSEKDVDTWIKNGNKLLSFTKPTCPMCGQDVTDIYKLILNEYNDYIQDEYQIFTQKIESIAERLNKIEAIFKQNTTNRELLEKYATKYRVLMPNPQLYEMDFQNTLDIIKRLVSNRNQNKLNTVDYENRFLVDYHHKLLEYNRYIDEINSIKNSILLATENISKSKDTLLQNIREAYKNKLYLSFITENNSTCKNAITAYAQNKSRIKSISNKRNELKIAITKEIQKMKLESKSINGILKYIGITTFSIEINDEKIVVIYDNERKETLKHSLSSGELNTLGFAYFMSKLYAERGSNYKDCIIYIDDPISSLDNDRIYMTASLIRNRLFSDKQIQERKTAEQIFISSHNFSFLKAINSIFPGGERRNLGEYMLQSHNGISSLEPLPSSMLGYSNAYYYGIERIQKCANSQKGELDDSELAVLPNTIRVCLESLLNFKFSFPAKKGKTFGLEDIVERLESVPKDSKLYSSLQMQMLYGQESREDNFLSDIRYIITKYSNIYSHGTAASILESNITYEEIHNICKKALHIIEILDPLHFESFEYEWSTNKQ